MNHPTSVFKLPKPVDDRLERERDLEGLPELECELAQQLECHAYICSYFSQKSFQVPPHIVAACVDLRTLALPERISRLQELNQELMEYVESVSEDSQLRM